MLSRSAFNALLKTLEEPPDNVKFILRQPKSAKCRSLFYPNVSDLTCAVCG